MANFLKLVNGRPEGEAMALTDLPSIATGTALANISGSSATPTAVSLVSTATASTIMLRDTNANVQANNLIDGYATTATAAGTTTLVVGSAYQQFFTGTTTQTVVLPVTSTLVLGQQFLITNASSGIVTVESSGANTVIAQSGSSSYLYTCVLTSGTTAASWYAVPYSGGGAVTPTVTVLTSGSGTFTTPSNALYLQVKMVGGGGGGAGSGTTAGNGGTGGNTTFGTSLLIANGGTGGSISTITLGGTATVNSPALQLVALQGASGNWSPVNGNLVNSTGGSGGVSPFGGAGASDNAANAGQSAISNTGSGGSGATQGSTGDAGAGGCAGGYIEAIITNPSSTYSYAVGTAGTAGTAGGSGFAGGAGGSGYIEITAFYNNGAVGTATNITGTLSTSQGGTGNTSGGMIGSNWVAYTPTLNGMTSSSTIYSRRVGSSLELYGTIVLTGVSASIAEISLGYNGTSGNVTVASTAPSSTFLCGMIVRNTSNTDEYFAQSVASQGFITIGIKSAGNPPYTAQNGSTLFGGTDTFAIMGVTVPIQGWTWNV